MTQPNQSNFSWEGFLVKMSRLQAEEQASKKAKDQASSTNSRGLQKNYNQSGFSSKMSTDSYLLPTEETSEQFSQKWEKSGTASDGEYWMLDSSVFPKDGVEYSLLEVLEKEGVSERYALSARAAKGILKRAAARGRKIAPELKNALEKLAEK